MHTKPTPSTPLLASPVSEGARSGLNSRAVRPIVRIERRIRPGQRLADLGPLLGKSEVARKIKHSVSWLDKAFAGGDIPRPVYIGRTAVWPESWIDDWLEAQVRDQLEVTA